MYLLAASCCLMLDAAALVGCIFCEASRHFRCMYTGSTYSKCMYSSMNKTIIPRTQPYKIQLHTHNNRPKIKSRTSTHTPCPPLSAGAAGAADSLKLRITAPLPCARPAAAARTPALAAVGACAGAAPAATAFNETRPPTALATLRIMVSLCHSCWCYTPACHTRKAVRQQGWWW